MSIARHDRVDVKNVARGERIASTLAGGALMIYGLRRGSWSGLAMAAAGGELLWRGASGYCPVYQMLGLHTAGREPQTSVPYEVGVRVEHAVIVQQPAADLYRFWRNFENLPRFARHLESVHALDDKRSHWRAKAPFGSTISWMAEVNHEEENQLIGWRSLPGSQVETAGSVAFRELPQGRGTEVRVVLQYNPPAGMLGAAIASLFHRDAGAEVKDDLRAFKQLMETGEILTTEGQTSGRFRITGASRRQWSARERNWPDEVQLASEESFPASDAPAWIPQRVGS